MLLLSLDDYGALTAFFSILQYNEPRGFYALDIHVLVLQMHHFIPFLWITEMKFLRNLQWFSSLFVQEV